MSALLTFLLLAPLASNHAPPLDAADDTWWRVAIPIELLQDAGLQKKLYSGLTTTFELEAEFKPKQRDTKHYALLQVRYEIWEEIFIVRRIEASGKAAQGKFTSLEEAAAWFQEEPLRIAPKQAGNARQLTVRCRVIPFSRGEERIAEDWFANVLRVPDAVTTGQVDRTTERSLTDSGDGGGIFEVLMSKSIRRKSIRTIK